MTARIRILVLVLVACGALSTQAQTVTDRVNSALKSDIERGAAQSDPFAGELITVERDGLRLYKTYVVVRQQVTANDRLHDTALARQRALDAMPATLRSAIDRHYKALPVLAATLSAAQVYEMAQNEFVIRVEPWYRQHSMWVESQGISGVTAIAGMPDDLTGAGTVIAFIDDGFDASHPSLGAAPYNTESELSPLGNGKIIGGYHFGNDSSDPTLPYEGDCTGQTQQHGTWVSSVGAGNFVPASVTGDISLRGTAPDAQIIAFAMESDSGCTPAEGRGEDRTGGGADFLEPLNWLLENPAALEEIDVLSTSRGSGGVFQSPLACSNANLAIDAALRALEREGLVMVAAVGNGGRVVGSFDLGKSAIAAPACLSSVISVGNSYDAPYNPANVPSYCRTDFDEYVNRQLFDFSTGAELPADHVPADSSNAPFIDLMAPGTMIQTGSSDLFGDPSLVFCAGGTSFSAPLVGGVAALLVQEAGPRVLSQQAMRYLLTRTGPCITDNNAMPNITKPRVDALAALTLLRSRLDAGQGVDQDADGKPDVFDNCIAVANPDQLDTDGDYYGNACDADIDGDGVVNVADAGEMRAAFFSVPGADNWDPGADLNGDDVVNVEDLSILRAMFFDTHDGTSGYFVFPDPDPIADLCAAPAP